MEKKNIARMCKDCMYFNPNKGICTKDPNADISGEIWFCPTYPNIKIFFYAVLHEHRLDFNDFTEEIKNMNENAQTEGWYTNLRLLKKKIETIIRNKTTNNKN